MNDDTFEQLKQEERLLWGQVSELQGKLALATASIQEEIHEARDRWVPLFNQVQRETVRREVLEEMQGASPDA